MRKINITMAVLAVAAVTVSCQKEKDLNVAPTLVDGEIGFYLGGAQTRTSMSQAARSTGLFDMGADEDGNHFYLEEITSLMVNDAPVTRGTPAYTENVAELYQQFAATVYRAGETSAFETDGVFAYDGTKYWKRKYPNTLFDKGSAYFYMWMPDVKSEGVSGLEYSAGKISFDYKAFEDSQIEEPEESTDGSKMLKAQNQRDLLFTSKELTEETYDEKTGESLLFHHAMTGIKFATANHISGAEEGTKTYITKVVFRGLADEGHCVITPRKEPNHPENSDDDIDDFSSGDGTTVVWSGWKYGGTQFYQDYTEANYAENIYSGSDYTFPTSFYADDKAVENQVGMSGKKTTDWNMNDKNATMTFWFIPQEVPSNLMVDITFVIDAGGKRSEEITRTLNLGAQIQSYATQKGQSKVVWKAGELRTYILKATEVAVTVEDEMLNETTKQIVTIRNTGNVPEWVRATVVGNWCIYQNENGEYVSDADYGNLSDKTKIESVAVYGYIDATSDRFVDPWDLDVEIGTQGSSYTYVTGRYGTFSTKNGEVISQNNFPGDNWVRGTDGYYYFTEFIGVDLAATKNLFHSYVVNTANKPTVYLLNRNTMQRYQVDVHLEMDIVVQAVLANEVKVGETTQVTETWDEAWQRALGYDPKQQ